MSDDASVPSPSPAPPADTDYDAICATLAQTARGRQFLAEHARRNRNADIALLLAASERIETVMRDERAVRSFDNVRLDLREMATAIARTKAEIAALEPEREQPGKLGEAKVELDSIVQATEEATFDILAAAERMQKTAWNLRGQGVDATLCDQIDAGAMEIYTACEFQDLTGQRTQKVIQVLNYLDGRINAMMRIWDDATDTPAAGPAGDETVPAIDQSGVDRLMQTAAPEPVHEATPPEVAPEPEQPPDRGEERVPAISWFDGMPPRAAIAATTVTQAPTPPPAPAPAPAIDDGADLLFEPKQPEEPASAASTDAKPDMLWLPLDVGMPDWAQSNGSAIKHDAASGSKRAKAEPRASDPLAALKAMSEEEKIALFS